MDINANRFNLLASIRIKLHDLLIRKGQLEIDLRLATSLVEKAALAQPAANETARKVAMNAAIAADAEVARLETLICSVRTNIAVLEMERDDIRLAIKYDMLMLSRPSDIE